MLSNYIRVAFRTLLKNKYFSLINIAGLAIGLTSAFLLAQYVSGELSYDKFHKLAKDTYRVTMEIDNKGSSSIHSARVAPAVATSLQKEFTDIQDYTRMVILGPDAVLTAGEKFVSEKEVYLADTSFFDIFSYSLLQGDPQTAFTEPFSIVITQTTANKLFMGENPLGREVIMNAANFDNTSMPFEVTGVVADFPENTHLKPAVLISYPTLFEFVGHRFDDSWTWNETYTYVRLNPGTNAKNLEAAFPPIVNHYNNTFLDEQSGKWTYHLQPVTSIHLHSALQHEPSVNGSALQVYTLGIVSLVILLLAYINFVNLVTVKSLNRLREVGIRKVSGAHKNQLIVQFFLEALIINGIALLCSATMIQLGRPYFNQLFDVELTFAFSRLTSIAFLAYIIFLIAGSGFYPAFILSGKKITRIVKGQLGSGKSGVLLRKTLVSGQFVMAMIIISLTLAATLQLKFMQQQTLGFSPEQIIVLKGPKAYDYGYGNNFNVFSNKIKTLPQVSSISGSAVVPGQEIYQYNENILLNGQPASGIFSVDDIDQNYFDHYGIPFITGRGFIRPGQQEWIINETALEQLGFNTPEDALDQSITRNGLQGIIVGVVRDFHHQSVKEAINPTLFYSSNSFNYYSIRMNSDLISEVLPEIEEAYSTTFPGSPFEYFFLDEFYNRQYHSDRKFSLLFKLFSGIAIFITILGLLGLSGFNAKQRTKEIGIRKVFGASIGNILQLLYREMIVLVFLSSLIAIPIAWLMIQYWLDTYAVHISISWWVLVPVGALVLISILSAGFYTFRAAFTNPVKSLRNE